MEYFKPEQYIELPTKDLLSWIFDSPPYDQDRPIYIDAKDPSKSISCNQARKIIRQLIAGLRAAGFKKGDCLSIHSFNDIHYSMIFLAVIGAGGVFAGTNPGYTQFELSHTIKTAKVTFLISEPEILDNLVAAAESNNIPTSNIWIFNTQGQPVPAGHKSWTELFKHGEEDWIRFDDPEICKTTTAARLFSSGTTGLPKAAVISHLNLIGQHIFVHDTKPPPHQISRVVAIPCFHAAAVPATHVSALKAGITLYIIRRFELLPFLEVIDKYSITDVSTVPPMAVGIVKSPFAKKDYLKKAKSGACGAAPLDKDVQSAFRSMLSPGAPYTQVWGMTETTCIATMFYYPEHDDTGSVGRQIPSLEIKLIDNGGKNISAYGVRGEICVRGPTVITGYFENPAANAESFDGDWFKTGDIGYCEEKTKKWYIVDRKKELIKVRGFQVAPPEIEAVLLSHPLIMDAAVIGVTFKEPGEEKIEHPRAYVVRQPVPASQNLTERELQEFAGAKLAKYKYLSGGVKFVESIPKNPSGKILKRQLRENAKKEIELGLLAKL
ncbi:4-coumarate-CoA ligase [Paracoccidioides lutzii Pb01]|uniref:4-coumarate-CoA ligase n=1 Tax=Paracoccidioides lutzii (strain ATCC MYA-826 / Pb01) TaxID=502779 RepID=C1H1W1_PARBA|nr:4-coumarate-CoA ligase [Paracoccidioides lutzii Pb01]EEH33848.1 4-coumarate-CoA ligase [Paracoccidioides lutzii Pb01]